MQPSLRFSPEDELLLLLLQGRRSLHHEARIHALLGASPDWVSLLYQAHPHGVVPLVAHHLQRLGYPGVPPAVVAELQRRARLNCARNLLMARELGRVLRQLMTAGIPVIPLKGVVLADALYDDYTLRECTDLDLLVPRAQIPHAVRVLEADGYRAEGPWQRWSTSPLQIEILLTRLVARLRYDVDLHWGLIGGDPRHHSASEDLWAAARPTTVLGVEAWAMSPEWELLFLALHAARSQWQGLKWLVDIQEICWTWAIDWQMVWAIAHKWGWEEILQLTIDACQSLWELSPSHGACSVLWPSWLPRFPDPPLLGWWQGLRVQFLLLPRWGLRIGYVLRRIETPTLADYRWLPLPAALFPLYYLLRPLRLVVKWGWWCLHTAVWRLGA